MSRPCFGGPTPRGPKPGTARQRGCRCAPLLGLLLALGPHALLVERIAVDHVRRRSVIWWGAAFVVSRSQAVGGMQGAKRHLRDALLLPLQHAAVAARAPLRLRTGLLLYGPPGCGKTHLVKCAAASAQKEHNIRSACPFLPPSPAPSAASVIRPTTRAVVRPPSGARVLCARLHRWRLYAGSSRSRVPSCSTSTLARPRRRCATCLSAPARRRPACSSSTSSTPSRRRAGTTRQVRARAHGSGPCRRRRRAQQTASGCSLAQGGVARTAQRACRPDVRES